MLIPDPWNNHNTLERKSALSLEPEQVAVVHCLIPHPLNHSQHAFNSHKKTKHPIVQDSSGWRSSRNNTYIRVRNPSENIQIISPILEYNAASSLIFRIVPISSYQCYYIVEILKLDQKSGCVVIRGNITYNCILKESWLLCSVLGMINYLFTVGCQ